MSAAPSSRSDYRFDIDGLRAVAVLSVVLYHAGVSLFSGGFTGVDVFFVISGYLIGGHIAVELNSGTFSFLSFYQRRAKRILPASLLVLASTLAMSLLFLSPEEMRKFCAEAIATSLFVSNFYFAKSGGYFAGRSETLPLLMTWSLGIEEQFYFIVPVLMLFLFRKTTRPILWLGVLAIASLCISIYQVHTLPVTAFYLLPARAWELAAGVILAVAAMRIQSRRDRSWAIGEVAAWSGLGCLLLPVFLLDSASSFPGLTALPSVLGSVLLIAAKGSWINRRVLSHPILTYIGRRSYSWYLWHWPLLALARILYGDRIPRTSALLLVGTAFLLAILTYSFVEQPFRRSTRQPAPLLWRYAVLSVCFVVACLGIWIARGFPRRFPMLNAQEENVQRGGISFDKCLVSDGVDHPNPATLCNEAGFASASVVLWGDSHGAAIAQSLREKAHAGGYNFIEATKTACPPLIGVSRWYPKNPAHASECDRFNQKTLAAIVQGQRSTTIFLAAYWADPFAQPLTEGWMMSKGTSSGGAPPQREEERLFVSGLDATVQALTNAGRHVIILEDAPDFALDPLWRLRTAGSSLRSSLVSRWRPALIIDPGFDRPADLTEEDRIDSLIQQIASRSPSTKVYSLRNSLCATSAACYYRRDTQLLYRDRQHLALAGAKLALQHFTLPQIARER